MTKLIASSPSSSLKSTTATTLPSMLALPPCAPLYQSREAIKTKKNIGTISKQCPQMTRKYLDAHVRLRIKSVYDCRAQLLLTTVTAHIHLLLLVLITTGRPWRAQGTRIVCISSLKGRRCGRPLLRGSGCMLQKAIRQKAPDAPSPSGCTASDLHELGAGSYITQSENFCSLAYFVF